jgi:hypothetical protein
MFRRTAYQYYTNVTYKSCETCLSWHGVIRRSPDAFPIPDDECESAILEIPGNQVRDYRQRAKRMRARAQSELQRRKVFGCAIDLLPTSPDEALTLFGQALAIDVYIPDIEHLAEVHADFLRERPEIREQIRTQFGKAYSDKFGWRRYERLPELMRLQREKAGMDRINELFG